jgi:hypothetical protein
LRHVNVATWQDPIFGLEAVMKHFQAFFFKNVLSSHDGHQYKCLQKSLEVMGEDARVALVSAKNEFEKLTRAPHWTDCADTIELYERPESMGPAVRRLHANAAR